ncbi:UDP-N-acetyl-D-glucosamine 6-dehydrogenase [Maioricimonas rarisocia]|uniref:UDP-N-acetyl-D-glucosamine 6-dehydrogenase n=1 Tax=Maioricimonas rarisocia TaxID=2528026 RepID=A0A517ZC94_9PLAN|nr:UDP-N-acetyl-D-mannosamine dehydrogenase [Maioricimonas rarisocia]QDU40077.1 UDP-N-acetyl-D-glucosamine 6-dehydrogenase [Maioricimonas rarisocia]
MTHLVQGPGGFSPAGQPPRRKICVVGLGYIGLPTAAILADRGYEVVGVDVRPDVVATINAGRIHVVEPHLDTLVEQVVREGKLRAETSPCEADVFFLCVPTPITEDHRADLSYVEAASESIKPYVRAGNLIILESTSPPKTTEDVVIPHAVPEHLAIGEDVYVAHCPERVLPGRILIEAVENDRIVGGMTPACTQQVLDFYRTFVRGNIHATSAITAEATKLVENAFRDVNIAFANELSILAGKLGADPFEIIELANHHPRVNILTPGPGVGGHCISVDPWFLVEAAPEVTPLIRTARNVNDSKPHFVIEQVRAAAASVEKPVIGCLGLAYKSDVDDLRESPSLEIVRDLAGAGLGELRVCEPYVTAEQFKEFPLSSVEETIAESNILVLLTDHSPFRELSADDLAGKHLIDTRGIWRKVMAEGPAVRPSLPIDPGCDNVIRRAA